MSFITEKHKERNRHRHKNVFTMISVDFVIAVLIRNMPFIDMTVNSNL